MFAIVRYENFFTTHCGIAADYRTASGFLPKPSKRDHCYGHSWQRLPLLLARIGNDSPRRYRPLDLERVRSQHHLGYAVHVQWNLGLWNSQPGLYVRSHLQHGRIVSLFLRRALLSRNDRYGHGCESVANTNGDTHAHTCADGDTYAHIYTDASSISYPDSNAYAHIYARAYPDIYADAYANVHADVYANGNINAYADSVAYTNAYGDAMHGKVYADAEAGSDSGAASHATASDSCHVHSRSYAEPRARGSYSCRG